MSPHSLRIRTFSKNIGLDGDLLNFLKKPVLEFKVRLERNSANIIHVCSILRNRAGRFLRKFKRLYLEPKIENLKSELRGLLEISRASFCVIFVRIGRIKFSE